MELCDWRAARNDDKVFRPVIRRLTKQDDQTIFAFDDSLAELPYDPGTKKLAEQCGKVDPLMCDGIFLFSRCAALINGPNFNEKVRRGRICGPDTQPGNGSLAKARLVVL